MKLTVADIAAALGVAPSGDGALVVRGLAEPAQAGADDLALAMSPRYAAALGQGQARAAVLWPGADWQAMGLDAAIAVGRPRLALADLTRAFDPGPGWPPGIHATAVIDPTAELGAGVSVGAHAVIGPGVRIGAGSRIGPQVTIGAGSSLGPDTLLHPGVRIGARVTAGARLIVHPNAVIGADGFSFVTPEVSLVENARHTLGDTGTAQAQDWQRIHSLGGVSLGEEVEIGACTAIDYGTIRPTRIGDRTKIDNHVHIAHNVVIGRSTLLAAHVAIAGSATIGDFCVFGGQAGLADNTTVGDRVIAGGASKILSNVPAGRVVQGYPAVRMETHVEGYKALRRLPRILAELRGSQKPVSKADESD